MQNTLYYIVKQFNNKEDNLLDFVDRHSRLKYGEKKKWELSRFAYETLYKGLKQVFNESVPEINFLESGKPVISGFSVSVAHSHSAVAVAFFRGDMPVGIDIELILNKKSERLNKLLNLESNASKQEQYLAFTKRESVIKAFDLKMLSSVNNNFKGVSKTVKVGGKEYALSVYFDGEIKEISL